MSPSKCAVQSCNKPAPKKCGTCKSISYCSTNCQKKDWSIHKIICAEYTSFEAINSRPADTETVVWKLAILFPDDEEKPRFIWVDCLVEEKLDDKGKKTHFEQCVKSVQKYLEDGKLFSQLKVHGFSKNSRLEFELDHLLEFWRPKTHCVDGSKENKSIMNILKKFPGHDWKGHYPVIALRKLANDNEEYSEYIAYQDVKLEDLPAIVRFFKTWDHFNKPFAEMSSED
jgi:hypothetical protein